MANISGWTVFLDRDRTTVARVARGQVEFTDSYTFDRLQPGSAAETIGRLLADRGHKSQPVLLALGSSDVISTTVSTPSSRRALKRTAMSFLVEPALPWSVEDSVIDYEQVTAERAFVIAAEAQFLRELVAALQEQDISVASIVPFARLALEHHLGKSPAIAPRYALAWGHGENVDLWLIENERPIVWRWLPKQISPLSRAIKQLALCEGEAFCLVGRNLSDELLASLGDATGLAICPAPPIDTEDPRECCAQQAAVVLGGRRESPIELSRDQLAPPDRYRSMRRELRVLQVSVVALLMVLGLGLGFKGRQIQALQTQCQASETNLFQSLFPKQKVPVAIRSQLESELARLKGIRGESTDLPALTPYAAPLERLFQALPETLRFRLLEIRIENGRLSLVGQVRAHGDADRIADGLRAAGLEVASPNTHRLEKEGVEFRISARLAPPVSKKPTRRPA